MSESKEIITEVKLPDEVAKKYLLVGVSTDKMITSEKHKRIPITWSSMTLKQAEELVKLPGFKYLKENRPPGPAPKD
jgi:hypothetical protein